MYEVLDTRCSVRPYVHSTPVSTHLLQGCAESHLSFLRLQESHAERCSCITTAPAALTKIAFDTKACDRPILRGRYKLCSREASTSSSISRSSGVRQLCNTLAGLSNHTRHGNTLTEHTDRGFQTNMKCRCVRVLMTPGLVRQCLCSLPWPRNFGRFHARSRIILSEGLAPCRRFGPQCTTMHLATR